LPIEDTPFMIRLLDGASHNGNVWRVDHHFDGSGKPHGYDATVRVNLGRGL